MKLISYVQRTNLTKRKPDLKLEQNCEQVIKKDSTFCPHGISSLASNFFYLSTEQQLGDHQTASKTD
jgi:hypothetical protein